MLSAVTLECLAYDIAEALDLPEGFTIKPDVHTGTLTVKGKHYGFAIIPNHDLGMIKSIEMETIQKSFSELLSKENAHST